jgi:hypothetical protein
MHTKIRNKLKKKVSNEKNLSFFFFDPFIEFFFQIPFQNGKDQYSVMIIKFFDHEKHMKNITF